MFGNKYHWKSPPYQAPYLIRYSIPFATQVHPSWTPTAAATSLMPAALVVRHGGRAIRILGPFSPLTVTEVTDRGLTLPQEGKIRVLLRSTASETIDHSEVSRLVLASWSLIMQERV